MLAATQEKLLSINKQFYQTFAGAFAHTRRRLQQGVWLILDEIPKQGRWLDLGCGNGELAAEWMRQRRQGSYTGLDFSPTLLEEATRTMSLEPARADLEVRFLSGDLCDPNWSQPLAGRTFDGVLAFAVLHHLPGANVRQRVVQEVSNLLLPGGMFIHSTWQFQNSPRMMERVQPWETVGLTDADLEPGDTLLDWRYVLPGQPEQVGLRYVHLFSREELAELAHAGSFELDEEFLSDGEGGKLGLYQVWKKK
ncbi:MAG TPA: class I SAM-dependent methyltransferase [Longilinea sp.]|nr:class I SAM-dependent methyltransferase [Longilinea sp.]